MTDYNAALADATARGYRVPITQPVEHEKWLNYWAVLEARDFDGSFQAGEPLPDPPDGIRFMERTEARTQGRTNYWTGRECQNGHMAPRYTTSGACRACISGYQRSRTAKQAGMVVFRALVHADDEALLRATVEALNAARGL